MQLMGETRKMIASTPQSGGSWEPVFPAQYQMFSSPEDVSSDIYVLRRAKDLHGKAGAKLVREYRQNHDITGRLTSVVMAKSCLTQDGTTITDDRWKAINKKKPVMPISVLLGVTDRPGVARMDTAEWPGRVFVDVDDAIKAHKIFPDRAPDPAVPGMAEYLTNRDPPRPVPTRVRARPPVASLLKPQRFVQEQESDTESDQDLPSTDPEEDRTTSGKKASKKPAKSPANTLSPTLFTQGEKGKTQGEKGNFPSEKGRPVAPTVAPKRPVGAEARPQRPAKATSPPRALGKAPGQNKTSDKPVFFPPPAGPANTIFPHIQFSPETDVFYRGISRERVNVNRGSRAVEEFNQDSIIKHLRYIKTIDDLVAAHPGKFILVQTSNRTFHFPFYCLRVMLGWKAKMPEVYAAVVADLKDAAPVIGVDCGCYKHLSDSSRSTTGAMTTIHKFAQTNVTLMLAKAQGEVIAPLVCHIVELKGAGPAPEALPQAGAAPEAVTVTVEAKTVVAAEAKTTAPIPAAVPVVVTPAVVQTRSHVPPILAAASEGLPTSGGVPISSSSSSGGVSSISSSSSAAPPVVVDSLAVAGEARVAQLRKRSAEARAAAQKHQEAFLRLMSEHLVLEANIAAYETLAKKARL
jgi:hypothetical protein